MCGILVHREGGNNSRVQLRGPDLTRELRIGGFTFVHNLLALTGQFTPQPFVDDEVVCLFNGEIYDEPFERTDGDVLIPAYRKLGTDFACAFNGEFSIALYDFGKEIAVFATDPFKTKPLFINGVECASYRSGIGGEPARPNEVVVKSFDGTVLHRSPTYRWKLTQFKDLYDDWMNEFERAVARRARPDCFIGLSSGYDSGGIACALGKLRLPFKAYTYRTGENQGVLDERLSTIEHEVFSPDRELLPWLADNLDNEPYTIVCNGERIAKRILDDGAAIGLATMAALARAQGRRIYLSGQGSDEIMSDYSPWPDQSELKGRFPEQLALWRNFNYSCQESYLMKEEYVAGAFGLEARYPYLDRKVVQEFLWLSADAKNRYYKAPLREYLRNHRFPFCEGEKLGFLVEM